MFTAPTVARRLMLVLFAVLWVPGLAMLWNATGAAAWPRLRLGFGTTFAQAPPPPPVAPSLATVLDGSYQHALAGRLGQQIPWYYRMSIVNNTILYVLFNRPGSPFMLIGPGRQILGADYVREYCTRDPRRFEAEARPWVERLAALQQHYDALGVVFVYLLTPSKPATMPWSIPPSLPCLASREDREAVPALYRRLLAEAGVRTVDGTEITSRVRERSGWDPFAASGVHWTLPATHPTAMALIEAVNDAAGRRLLAPYRIALGPPVRAAGNDRDLLNLLSLPIRWLNPWVASWSRVPEAGPVPSCGDAPIALVGGSFLHQVARMLGESPCRPQISLFFYLRRSLFSFDGTVETSPPMGEEVDPADYRRLDAARIVVLEENAQLLPGTDHARAFADRILGPAAAPMR